MRRRWTVAGYDPVERGWFRRVCRHGVGGHTWIGAHFCRNATAVGSRMVWEVRR